MDKYLFNIFSKFDNVNDEIIDIVINRDDYIGKVLFIISSDFHVTVKLFKLLDRYFYRENSLSRIRYIDGNKLKRLRPHSKLENDLLLLNMHFLKNSTEVSQICNFALETSRFGVICLFSNDQKVGFSLINKPLIVYM